MTLKKALGTLLMCLSIVVGKLQAQTASFNFSLTAHSVSGWTNVYGDPSLGVRTATSPSGISISSMATANWAGFNSTAAFDGGGAAGGTFFPAAVMANLWYQYSSYYGAYNAAVPQLEISGLRIDSVYTIMMTGSLTTNVPNTFNLNPIRYTVAGVSVNGYIDVNGNFNTADGATFHNIAPDANGKIHVYVNTLSTTNLAGISGLQITSGHTNAPSPTVSISKPQNGDILPENASVTISASATETGGTISRVEFYANNTLLGVDSSAPYSFVWTNADPGNYTIKARAIDGTLNTNSTTINVTVESLNYFWSTTGNIATGADSSFVGTVDTNDLAFRTNNIERMRMSKSGTISIPGTRGDSVNHPAFRVYGNGDFSAGTTTDKTVNTQYQSGLRYYAKASVLQIGASDRLDTAQGRAAGRGPTASLIVNSDDANSWKGTLTNSVLVGDANTMDSTAAFYGCIVVSELSHFNSGMIEADKSIINGTSHSISAVVDNSTISGLGINIAKPITVSSISGFENVTADTSSASLIGGANNQFGGNAQFVAGRSLINRTPAGAAIGTGNVDFSTLSYTGQGSRVIANLSDYPLLAVGNAQDPNGAIRSNALTVMYNGRTQINTTGFGQTLTQTAVTPKAALDVVSTNSGVLLPRLTSAQRNAIASGDLQNGLLLYNTDSSAFQYYNGAAWSSVGSGTSGSSSGHWMYNSGLQYDSVNSVAIGTNRVPTGYMLAVKGSGIFTHLQVKSVANWPDYVFEKNYQLMTLEDLAAYIDKYKHLPDITSVAKVNAEGVDLGANQAAILKNVEELTLHLIEENKQLKTQSAKAAELEKKVADQSRQINDQNTRFADLQRQIDALKGLLNKTNN